MERRPKIGIVAGDTLQPRFLALFEPLRDAFDTCIYALHHERLINLHQTGMKLRVFENITDMPGFMRGLEEELASSDLIIGLETSRLATFQAVRAARKFSVPMGVVVNEFLPYFYESYANIRAIQYDICNKSEHFWATSNAAVTNLRLDSVPEESISLMSPIIDLVRFRHDGDGRKRFRDYVGIAATDLVILFQHELVASNRPMDLLNALALLRKLLGPRADRVRILFVGSGAQTMDLKYRSHDLGLGKQVMFLHQDPEPFLVDMYSACDAVFAPRPLPTEQHQEIPLALLEGMACGLTPIAGAGSVAAEFAAGLGLLYPDDSCQSLAARLQPLVLSTDTSDAERLRVVAHVHAAHSRDAVGPSFVAEIQRVLITTQNRDKVTIRPAAVLQKVEADLSRGAESEAMVQIEEALLVGFRSPTDRSELIRLKGDALYARGQVEGATAAYAEGLQLDERNFRCLRGLGYASWQGHSNEEALMYFRKALAISESDPQTMLGIGLVFRRLGLHEEALVWLEKCVVGFMLPAAVIALAQTCNQLTRHSAAIAVLDRVIDAVGENHTLMMTLGQLYLNSGRTAEGNAILQKALDCA